MRLFDALLRAMRKRRTGRLGLHQADRLVAGDRSGPGSPGLDHLLDAVRAPATAEETAGEQAMAAALAAERRRVAPPSSTKVLALRSGALPSTRSRASARTIVVGIAAGVALLGAGGTAVAARTGHLPAAAQQRAHRLFSGLGVPAPETGGPTSAPHPSGHKPSPSPTPSRTPSPSPTPSPTPSPSASAGIAPELRELWCAKWRDDIAGGKPLDDQTRAALTTAAGSKDKIAVYCGWVASSPTPSDSTSTAPSTPPKSRPVTPSHPAPHAATPSHPHPGD